MLKYCKTILQKVSFDQALFEKELQKALTFIQPSEYYDLLAWCKNTFGDRATHIVNRYLGNNQQLLNY